MLYGLGMQTEWTPGIVVLIFKEKGDNKNNKCHRVMKLLEHGMKVMEMVLEKRT